MVELFQCFSPVCISSDSLIEIHSSNSSRDSSFELHLVGMFLSDGSSARSGRLHWHDRGEHAQWTHRSSEPLLGKRVAADIRSPYAFSLLLGVCSTRQSCTTTNVIMSSTTTSIQWRSSAASSFKILWSIVKWFGECDPWSLINDGSSNNRISRRTHWSPWLTRHRCSIPIHCRAWQLIHREKCSPTKKNRNLRSGWPSELFSPRNALENKCWNVAACVNDMMFWWSRENLVFSSHYPVIELFSNTKNILQAMFGGKKTRSYSLLKSRTAIAQMTTM